MRGASRCQPACASPRLTALLLWLGVSPYLTACKDSEAAYYLSGESYKDGDAADMGHVHLIYFYNDVKLRRLCALESTLRSNPGVLVHVHTTDAEKFIRNYKQTPLKSLHADRVVVHTTSFKQLFSGTPLGIWYSKKIYKRSKWVNQNLANAARLALLYKNGGTYSDLDYIIQRNLSSLSPNFMAVQEKRDITKITSWRGHKINNGFLRFEAKHPFLKAAADSFVREFSGGLWGKQGPDLMTRVYGRKCKTPGAVFSWCGKLALGSYDTVYPFPWRSVFGMLKDGRSKFPRRFTDIIAAAPAVHLWSHVWEGRIPKPGSFIAELLQQGCPLCYPDFLEPSVLKRARRPDMTKDSLPGVAKRSGLAGARLPRASTD